MEKKFDKHHQKPTYYPPQKNIYPDIRKKSVQFHYNQLSLTRDHQSSLLGGWSRLLDQDT